VANYVDALEHGLKRLAELPINLRLIREMHARLMSAIFGGRGSISRPESSGALKTG
jgi:hypothetical protein